MQHTMIIGNLTADPVLRSTQDGKQVATFTVAVNEKRNGKDYATFYNCSAWEKRAEPIVKYLTKGSKVYVDGKVSARAYKTKDGEQRASLDLNVSTCEFLDTAKRGEAYDSDVKDDFVKVDDPDLPF